MDAKALSEGGGAGALTPPASGVPITHVHAKAGGGRHKHSHPSAPEGHTHGAGSEDGHPDVALLPMQKGIDVNDFKGFTWDWEIKSVTTQTDGTLILKGYGNTWSTDRDGETTHRKAFDHTLDEFLTGNPILLYNHKEGQEIGTVTVAKPDQKGLYVEAEVPPPPPGAPGWHVKCYHDIKRRILRAFSMGGVFHRGKSEATRNSILRVDLYEMSVVSIPANGASLFAVAEAKGLKFEPETKAPREFTAEERQRHAESGAAMSDGSYPIIDRDSLRRAIASYGRNATPAVKAPIVKRARALNLTDMLPEDWKRIADLAGKMTGPERASEFIRILFRDTDSPTDEQIEAAYLEASGKRVTQQPGVGRGHGRHHHGPLGPRKRGLTHSHTRGTVRHSHATANLGPSHTDSQLANKHGIAAEAVPAVRTFAQRVGKDPMKLTTGEVRQAILDANPGVAPAALGLSYTPPDAKASGASDEEPGTPDPADEAEEIEERGDLGELLEGLQEAIDEVVERNDLADQDKVDSISVILKEFTEEAPDYLSGAENAAEGTTEDEPAKSLAFIHSKSAAVGQHIATALAQLQREETHMGDENQNTGTEGKGAAPPGGGTIQLDRKQWDETQSALQQLLNEKRERDMETKAAEMAAKQIADEQAAAEAKAVQQRAEDERLGKMAAMMVEQLRAGMTGGRKFVHPTATTGNGTEGKAPGYSTDGTAGGAGRGRGRKGFAGWLRDLKNSKKGDYAAFQRLEEMQLKAAEYYATDEDGEIDTKALAEATTGAGGFLVPPQYWQQGIAEFRLAAAKIRKLVTVITSINTNLVYIPRETGVATVGWTAENAAKPATDQTFGQLAVNIFTLAGISKVSNQLLEDSSPAVDQIVRKDLGRVLGQAEDVAFINGSGVGMPTGILQTAGVLSVAYAAPTAGSGLGDAISAAMTAVDSNFFDIPNAILAHPRMIAKLRQVKDSQGRYIFEPGFWAGGGPWGGTAQSFLASGAGNIPGFQTQNPSNNPGTPVGSVWGVPVWSDANIPTTLNWTGSAYTTGGTESPIILGVWEEAYLLERSGVTLDVSSEAGTSFEQNQTWFRGEERIGFTAARQPTAFAFITGLNNGIAG